MKSLTAARDYKTAAEIADSINWHKIKNVNALMKAAEIYEMTGRYEESKEILLMAYDRSPIGRMIVYRLAEVAIKMKNFDDAKEYYQEFVEVAPHDNLKYVLKYEISKAEGADYDTLIAILEELKEQEYSEEWAYELACLYHKAGMSEKCIEACDDLILWFGDGPYVERALELKMVYQPLTKQQEEKYRQLRQGSEGVVEVRPEDELDSGEIVSEPVQIPKVKIPAERFNTQNLQEELQKSMRQIMAATEKEDVDSGMDTIKKLVEDIPYLQLPKEEPEDTAGGSAHIPTDQEIDNTLRHNFKEYLAEDTDGQMSMFMPEDVADEPQPDGRMSIEGALRDWEKTKRAAEAALLEADRRKLESAKARALQEAGDIMERLADAIPKLDSGLTPQQLLVEEYLRNREIGDDRAAEVVVSMNQILQREIDRLSTENARIDERIAAAAGNTGGPTRVDSGYGAAAGEQSMSDYGRIYGQSEPGNYETVPGRGRFPGYGNGHGQACMTDDGARYGQDQMNGYGGLPDQSRMKNYGDLSDQEQRDLPGYGDLPDQGQMSGYGEVPGQEGIPGYEILPDQGQTAGYEEIPRQAVLSGYEGQPDQEQVSGYGGLSGQGVIPGHGKMEGWEAMPGYEGLSGQGEQSGYEELSGQGQMPGYGEMPGYGAVSGYEGQPGQEQMSGYGKMPGQSELSGYEGRPGQEQISGYEGVSGQEQTSGYGEVSGQGVRSGYEDWSGQEQMSGYDGVPGQGMLPGYMDQPGQEQMSGYGRLSDQEAAPGYGGVPGEESSLYGTLAGTGGTAGYANLSGRDALSGYGSLSGEEIAPGYAGQPDQETASDYGGLEGQELLPGYGGPSGQELLPGYGGVPGEESSPFYGAGTGTGNPPSGSAARWKTEDSLPKIAMPEGLGLSEGGGAAAGNPESSAPGRMNRFSTQPEELEETLLKEAAKTMREDVNQSFTGREVSGRGTSSEKGREKTRDTLPEIAEPGEEEFFRPITKLSREQREIFTYFVQIRGMEQQLCQALTGSARHLMREENAGTGNLVILGDQGSGKTMLARNVIKALQAETGKLKGRSGKLEASALNEKDLVTVLKQVAGGCLIIEKAGELKRETAIRLSQLLRSDESGLFVIMEDTHRGIRTALSRDAGFAAGFTEKINIPIFTSDELVSFAKSYANELGYTIDEMGILALYNSISSIQKLDRATTLTEVKEIVDEAIVRVERGVFKKALSILTSRRYDDEDYVVLHEKDFVF